MTDIVRSFYITDIVRSFYMTDIVRSFYMTDINRSFYMTDIVLSFEYNECVSQRPKVAMAQLGYSFAIKLLNVFLGNVLYF